MKSDHGVRNHLWLLVSLLFILLVAGCAAGDDSSDGGDDDDDADGDESSSRDDDDNDTTAGDDDDEYWDDDDDDDYWGDADGDEYWDDDDDDDYWDDDDDDDYWDDDDDDEYWDDDDDNDDTTDGDEEDPQLLCPETEDPMVLYLSSDDSTSMASPVLIRNEILNGGFPSRNLLRMWEFLNYYTFDYTPPSRQEVVKLHADMALVDAERGVYSLQVAARAYDLRQADRAPANIVFILDTSGSMGGTPINLLREVCKATVSALRAGDTVSMVTWNTSQNVLLDGYEVTESMDSYLLGLIDDLKASNGTNLHAGLMKGYELVNRHYITNGINRALLISDGVANAGVTDIDTIADYARDTEGYGIYLTGVGVGQGVNDTLMEQVTDAGRGGYIYIDSVDEANELFQGRFLELMGVAARSLQMEVTLPWYFLMEEFHGEEWSENPEEVEPQHLAPNDAMVFHQTILACDSSLPNQNDTITAKAIFADPITGERHDVQETFVMGELLQSHSDQAVKGDMVVDYVKALEMIAGMRPLVEDMPLHLLTLKARAQSHYDTIGDLDYLEIAQVLQKLSERVR